MRNRSDQFAKNILRDALSRASTAETEVEVLASTQRIDVYAVPDPALDTERAQMGLLGELAAEPSLFEPFHNTPTLREIRRCVCKQHTWHNELERRARAVAGTTPPDADPDAPPSVPVPFPALVVIGLGRPETVLAAYGCKAVSDGVYHAVRGLEMRVVVLTELPRTRETLLLRLLGAGPVLRGALADLEALPEDGWEKSVATPMLIHFRIDAPPRDEEDDVTSTEIRAWYEEYQRKTRAENRAEEAARNVLAVLRVRGIAVPDADRERIQGEKDPERLERWHERAIVAASVAEVIDEPS